MGVLVKVAEELLSERAWPGRDGFRRFGAEGGNEGAKLVKDLHQGVVCLLARGRIKAGGCELAKLVEDGLGGGVIANVGSNVVGFEEMTEAVEVADANDGGEGISR